jgi:Domain of unknown function (DUF2017)
MATVTRESDTVVLRLDVEERTVLAGLAASLADLLEPARPAATQDPLAAMVGMSAEAVDVPDDPALRRLLPDAYADDPGKAAEFRRLTDTTLRHGKAAALRAVHDTVAAAADGAARVPLAEVDGWMSALNDIRLVLGVRLDVTEDREGLDALAADDPRLPLLAAYDWLSWLLEVMIAAVAD